MGKIVFWIVVVFAVLMVLRLVNASKTRARRDQGKAGRTEAMVQCASCGVYLPRADAKPGPSGLTCGEPKCLSR